MKQVVYLIIYHCHISNSMIDSVYETLDKANERAEFLRQMIDNKSIITREGDSIEIREMEVQ